MLKNGILIKNHALLELVRSLRNGREMLKKPKREVSDKKEKRYDICGVLFGIIKPKRATKIYDVDGKLIKDEILSEYNEDGKLIHNIDGQGCEQWFEYDEKGNCLHEKSNNRRESWYEYDVDGNRKCIKFIEQIFYD